MAHPDPILPVRALPRDEIEVNGGRVIQDARGGEIAYVPFDEDAEYIARAVNAYPAMVAALKLARVALLYSTPDLSHYPEPVKRHADAHKAVGDALLESAEVKL